VLSHADWESYRFYADRDVAMHDLVERLTAPAQKAKLDLLQQSRRLAALDPAELQDLHASTAMLVRALLWSSQLLSIEPPALYLRAEVVGQIARVAAPSASVLASRTLGSGITLQQLVFLWGRSAAVFRPEQHLAVFYPTVEELCALIEAARAVVGAKRASGPAGELAPLLEKAVPRLERASLAPLLERVGEPRAAAQRWLASCELASTRAGLLCSGDLANAVRLIQKFPFGRVTTAAEQADDLLAWSVGEAYQELRKQLGVAIDG
jgi:hypothetical protein